MSIRSTISRLLSTGFRRQQVAPTDFSPQLVDWPLPEALPITPPNVRRAFEPRVNVPAGITVFPYPFHQPEIAGFVRSAWYSSADGRNAKDGKYCEFTAQDGSTYYIPCVRLIDTLRLMEGQAGRGLSRLRLVALVSFGYEEEARALFREFEKESGPAEAAMGFARVLLSNNQPERALETVSGARQQGARGAALAACEARISFACGLTHDGLRLASEALRNVPDALWMPADHFYTWGLLHGAALASREDAILRQELLSALDSLCQQKHSARRALACASLAAIAGDLSASSRAAHDALSCADVDSEVAAEAVWLLRYARNLDSLVTRFNQPPISIDTRCDIHSLGWFLDRRTARPERSTWHDRDGDTITLSLTAALEDTKTSDVEALRNYCRQVAEDHGAGLVEASVILGQLGPAVQMIYKQLEKTAFTFTGMQIISLPKASLTWSIVAGEKGTTGVREAVVTSSLMHQGRLTPELYEEAWACDPYDPLYRGVDRSRLRYMSDNAIYDAQFPTHPLSKVRRVLHELSRESDLSEVAPNLPTQPSGFADD